jgi:hypothetical protein
MLFDKERINTLLEQLEQNYIKLSQRIEKRSSEKYIKEISDYHNENKGGDDKSHQCSTCEMLSDVEQKKECLKLCRIPVVSWDKMKSLSKENNKYEPDIKRLQMDTSLKEAFFAYQKNPERIMKDYKEDKEKTVGLIVELMGLPIAPITLPDEAWAHFIYILSYRNSRNKIIHKKQIKEFIDTLSRRKNDYTEESKEELAKKLHRHDHHQVLLNALQNDGVVLM